MFIICFIFISVFSFIFLSNCFYYKNKINKVFVINLPRRKERLEIFKNNYNLNIPFNVIDAIDGYEFNINELYNTGILGIYGLNSIINNKKGDNYRKYHYELTNEGSIGCYLSHYHIWKNEIYNKDLQTCLIFEDDSIFNNISLEDIYSRLSSLPNNWDIYLLSDPNDCYDYYRYKKNLLKVNRFFLTNAYVIKTKAIKKILKSKTIFPINQQLDSYLSELAIDFHLNIYIHDNNFNFYKQNNNFTSDIQFDNENQANISYKRLRL